MNILVVAAHPDDEVLGCGGTMARLAEAGHQVHVSILGEGITSRYARREDADPDLLDELQGKSKCAAARLGAVDVENHGLPDNRFDSVALLDVVKILEARIQTLRPERVYTQHGGDLNVDHGITFRAVMTATRPMADCPVAEVLAYEVASSTEWSFHQFTPEFRPNVFVEIAQWLDAKIEAMQAYESEARTYPHPRSPESLKAIARRWGSAAGLQAAEAFQLIRFVSR